MSEEQNFQQPYETSTLAIVSLVSGIVRLVPASNPRRNNCSNNRPYGEARDQG